MIADLPPAYECVVERIVDADTWKCRNGIMTRAGAINARESDGTCRRGMVCPIMPPARAKAIVTRMVLHKRLTCEPMGKSWNRTVAACRFADDRSVSCAIAATGAAAWEPSYARRYGMRCP